MDVRGNKLYSWKIPYKSKYSKYLKKTNSGNFGWLKKKRKENSEYKRVVITTLKKKKEKK